MEFDPRWKNLDWILRVEQTLKLEPLNIPWYDTYFVMDFLTERLYYYPPTTPPLHARTHSRNTHSRTSRHKQINTMQDDELATMATDFTPGEVAFFKHIVDLVMGAGPDYEISSTAALQAGKTVGPDVSLSNAQAQDFLDRMVRGKWLGLSGYVVLNVVVVISLVSWNE